MRQDRDREVLKDEIEKMREKLNKIVIGDVKKSEVVEFSQKLDNLINEYYSMMER